MTNFPARLSSLNQEIGALTEKLKPAGAERVAECLDALKRGGMGAPAGIAPADFLREYALALSNVPACGLMAAIIKLKRGEYAGVRPGFMPVPAELAALARLEARGVREDMARAKAKAEALLQPTRAQVPAEGQARVRALVARFRKQAEAAGAEPPAAKMPLSAERADYWARIAATGDAPMVTAEQMAFRRRLEGEIAGTEDGGDHRAE